MNPETLKKICVYLAFGLIVSLTWIVADCEGDRNSDLSKDSKISKLEAMDRENKELQDSVNARNRVLSDSLVKTSVELAKATKLFVEEKNARKQDRRELFALRAASGIKVDTVTLLIEGNFQAQIDSDSIQIQKLEARILSDSSNYTDIIHGWVTKFNSEVAVSEDWRIQAVDATKDAHKYKKQRNAMVWSLIGEAFAIVILALIIAL